MAHTFDKSYRLVGGPMNGLFYSFRSSYIDGRPVPNNKFERVFAKEKFDEIGNSPDLENAMSKSIITHVYERVPMSGENNMRFCFFKHESLTINEAMERLFDNIEVVK